MNIFYVLKKQLKLFFTFTNQELKGLLFLCFILLIVTLFRLTLPHIAKKKQYYSDNELRILSEPLKRCLKPLPSTLSSGFSPSYSSQKMERDTLQNTRTSFYQLNKQKQIIEINQADSASLTSLRGLGPYFASKIIKLRNKYRGLYSIWQLLEIYRMDSAKIQALMPYLSVNKDLIRKHDVNNLSKDSIKGNYYFSFKMVDLINNYRKQHGPYKAVDEIKTIEAIPDSSFRKIKYYLEIRN